MPQPLRSVLAVLAGFAAAMIVVIVCTLACIKAFHLHSGHPTPVYLALNVTYSIAAGVLGGWICARIAKRSPLIHGAALAIIMFGLSAMGYSGPNSPQPVSYQIFVIIALPLAALGGALLVRKERSSLLTQL